MDEDQRAAHALSDMLATLLLKACDDKRNWLYCWERDGLQWLIRFMDRRSEGIGNAWTFAFIDLNRDAILDTYGVMDFNLRAARMKKEANA
jgi:hypothetical protein